MVGFSPALLQRLPFARRTATNYPGPDHAPVSITLDLLLLFGRLLETMPRVALVLTLTSAVSRSQRHSSLAEPGGGLQ